MQRKYFFSKKIFLVNVLVCLSFYSLIEIGSFLMLNKKIKKLTVKPDYAGGVSFKKNISLDFPGYITNLETDQYGFIHNGNKFRKIYKDAIFLFGGSTVAGIGASSNKTTISSQLEICLKNRKINSQVINMGFPGDYSIQQRDRLFNNILIHHKPSLIIFFDGRNDAHYTTFKKYLPFNANVGIWKSLQKGSFDETKPKLFFNTSKLITNKINFLKEFYKKRIKSDYLITDAIEDNIKKGINIYNDVGNDVEVQLSNLNIKFIRVLQPTLFVSNRQYTESENKFIKDYTARYRINNNLDKYKILINKFYNEANKNNEKYFYNLQDIFEDIREEVYVDTVHYSDTGNEIIANKICKIID